MAITENSFSRSEDSIFKLRQRDCAPEVMRGSCTISHSVSPGHILHLSLYFYNVLYYGDVSHRSAAAFVLIDVITFDSRVYFKFVILGGKNGVGATFIIVPQCHGRHHTIIFYFVYFGESLFKLTVSVTLPDDG